MISQEQIDSNSDEHSAPDENSGTAISGADNANNLIDHAGTSKKKGKRFNSILDAAETVFATSGFNGASMREIAETAGVAQALIHYHFDTKERLLEEVIARRSGEINQLREQRLAALFNETLIPKLEEITEVLIRPTIEVGHRPVQSSNSYARILVFTANGADDLSTKLASRYYDPIAKQFIAAFEKATPGLSHENAVWAYMFTIGVGMTMMAQTGRSYRLSDGLCDDRNIDAMLARIIPFITAGIRAVIDVSDPTLQTTSDQNSNSSTGRK
jgi:AcrR family transcriptional regulator